MTILLSYCGTKFQNIKREVGNIYERTNGESRMKMQEWGDQWVQHQGGAQPATLEVHLIFVLFT